MNQAISHKLAPFLDSLDSDFKGPVAGYATCSPITHLLIPDEKNKAPKKTKTQLSGDSTELLQLAYSHEFDLLMDIFCVDQDTSFNLFYLFQSTQFQESQIFCLENKPDSPVPTLTPYYASANWLERECFDLFGVYFEGHPDLRRLLLYPEFAGHPLKKNYPIHKAQPLIPLYA